MRLNSTGLLSTSFLQRNVLLQRTRSWRYQLRCYAPRPTTTVPTTQGRRGSEIDPWLRERFDMLDAQMKHNTHSARRPRSFVRFLTRSLAIVGVLFVFYEAYKFGNSSFNFLTSQLPSDGLPSEESVEELLAQSEAVRILEQKNFVQVDCGGGQLPCGTMVARVYFSSNNDQAVVLFGFDKGSAAAHVDGVFPQHFQFFASTMAVRLAGEFFHLKDETLLASFGKIDSLEMEPQSKVYAVTITPSMLVDRHSKEEAKLKYCNLIQVHPTNIDDDEMHTVFFLRHWMFEQHEKSPTEVDRSIVSFSVSRTNLRNRPLPEQTTVHDPFDLSRAIKVSGSEDEQSTTVTSTRTSQSR